MRWGKENPFAARLAAVREARKQRKAKAKAQPKGKAKAGAVAKPKATKPTPEQRKAEREQQKQAEQQQNREKTFKDLGLFEDATAALSDLAAGKPVDDDGGLVKMGLAEQADDGTYRLTPAGRQLHNAANRGDLGMARDTLSRAGDDKRHADDRAQQQEKAAAREQTRAERQAEREKRAAEREKAKAEKEKQGKGGGGGGKGKDDAKDKEKAAKEQARRERTERVQALQLGRLERGGNLTETQLADLEAEGLIEIDADGTPQLTPDGKRRVAKKRSGGDEMTASTKSTETTMSDLAPILDDLSAMLDELTEISDERLDESAIKAGRRNSASDQAIIQQIYDRAEDVLDLAEALGAETSDENPEAHTVGGMVETLAGKSIDYEQAAQRVREAWYRAARQMPMAEEWPYIVTVRDDSVVANLGGRFYLVSYTDQDGAIVFAARTEWQEVKPDYVPVTKSVDLSAVKLAEDDTVYGPAVLFGSVETHDLSPLKDYFTKATDFWLNAWDKRPMIWHHALPQQEMLNEMRAAGASKDEIKAMREALTYLDEHPVVGVWTKATVDPVGVWLKGQVDKAHKYRDAVKRMIELGLIKISTDSAPHLVKREAKSGGVHEVKRWPIIAASLTPTAAEPRLADVQALKSYYELAGLTPPAEIDDTPEAHNAEGREGSDGTKAATDDRARQLSLHIRRVALQE